MRNKEWVGSRRGRGDSGSVGRVFQHVRLRRFDKEAPYFNGVSRGDRMEGMHGLEERRP